MHSPQYKPVAPASTTCQKNNPTCCEFAVRIMDKEDPALQYAPFGPKQELSRCADVTMCNVCQYEVAGPTVSSDRQCKDLTPYDPCYFLTSGEGSLGFLADGSGTVDRTWQLISTCNYKTQYYDPSSLDLSKHSTSLGDCGDQPARNTDVACVIQPVCTTLEYDSTYIEIMNSNQPIATCTADPVYTKARVCKSIMKCEALAREVHAPALLPGSTDPHYVGDRVCQCPDPPEQSNMLNVDPFDSTRKPVPFWPNKYTGNWNKNSNIYTCSECSPCAAGTYVSRRCTHGTHHPAVHARRCTRSTHHSHYARCPAPDIKN
jgi:hypothetical protein